jgi:hypothetical protein
MAMAGFMETQVAVVGDTDVRVRATGDVERGLTWQVSGQLYGGREGDGFYVYPALSREQGDFMAFRFGGMVRHPLSERTSLQLGMAWEPVSVVEGVVVGSRNNIIPHIAVVAVPAMAMLHTMESTVAVRHALSDRVAVEAGVYPSGASMWFHGDPFALTLHEHPARRVLEGWQPGVGLSMVW